MDKPKLISEDILYKQGRLIMEDWKKRVELEAVQLDDKLTGLNEFLSKQYLFPTHGLTERASDLLVEQSVHMAAYLGVLRKRLKMIQNMSESI